MVIRDRTSRSGTLLLEKPAATQSAVLFICTQAHASPTLAYFSFRRIGVHTYVVSTLEITEDQHVYSEGDSVKWAWGSGYGHGTVKSIFVQKTIRHIDGNEVIRHGSQDNPAYYIEVDDGNNVLKLHSEVERA